MIQNAAMRYCHPEVVFYTKEWNVEGKKVLEVIIPKGEKPPYRATDKEGKAKAYIRIADENIVAGFILPGLAKMENTKENQFFSLENIMEI